MSPSRRQQFVPGRPRSEVYVAIAVGVGIVVGTALLIWLMRPGKSGVPGGGGLFARQPRMTILVILTAAALSGVVAFVTTRRHLRFGVRGSIAVGSASVVVLAVVGGIFWPGGVIRHWPKQPKIDTTPTPATTPVTSPTTLTPATTPTTAKTATSLKTPTTVASPTTKASTGTSTPPTTAGG